jgi:hypothetical protein
MADQDRWEEQDARLAIYRARHKERVAANAALRDQGRAKESLCEDYARDGYPALCENVATWRCRFGVQPATWWCDYHAVSVWNNEVLRAYAPTRLRIGSAG